MGGFFDERVSDETLCNRVWTMFVRCGFAPGAHVADIEDDQEDEMGGKRITEDERSEILRRHGEGENFQEIAKALERHPTFISGVVKSAGASPAKAVADARPEPVKRKVSTGSPLDAIRAERDRLRSAADALDAALGLLE